MKAKSIIISPTSFPIAGWGFVFFTTPSLYFSQPLQFYGPAVTIITFYFNRMLIPPIYVFIFWRQDNECTGSSSESQRSGFLSSTLHVMVICQNQYINLYPLIQITFKILYTYNLHFRKRNIFQDLKVLIFCNNTLCICSNGTIYKLIVIFV